MRRCFLLFLLPALVGAEDRGLGRWHFDPQASRYESGPPPRQSVREWSMHNGHAIFLHQGVDSAGNPFRTTFTAGYDGRPGRVEGASRYDAVSLSLRNDSTVDQIFTKDGQITVETTRTISPDGNTMFIIAVGKHADGRPFRNFLVYRKR